MPMSVTTFERQTFGEPLTAVERLIGGVVVAAGAIGHIALGLTAAVFLYALLFGL